MQNRFERSRGTLETKYDANARIYAASVIFLIESHFISESRGAALPRRTRTVIVLKNRRNDRETSVGISMANTTKIAANRYVRMLRYDHENPDTFTASALVSQFATVILSLCVALRRCDMSHNSHATFNGSDIVIKSCRTIRSVEIAQVSLLPSSLQRELYTRRTLQPFLM